MLFMSWVQARLAGGVASVTQPRNHCGIINFMNNEEAVKQVLSDYYNAFSTLDVQSILPYFHQPALLIGPLGLIAIPTPAAVVPIFGPVMEDLRQRTYGRRV